MTLGFSELTTGDSVEVRGPIGHFEWKGNGLCILDGKERRIHQMGMICGGSGIAPCLQVLRCILDESLDDLTNVWLLDTNRHVDDILCRDELDRLALQYGPRFRVHYTITGTVPDDWQHSRGRIDEVMLRMNLPAPNSTGSMVCICGPPTMEQGCKGK